MLSNDYSIFILLLMYFNSIEIIINNYKKNSVFKFDIFSLNSLLVDTQVHQLNYSYNAISYYGVQDGCLI